jgi:hypothetical protein
MQKIIVDKLQIENDTFKSHEDVRFIFKRVKETRLALLFLGGISAILDRLFTFCAAPSITCFDPMSCQLCIRIPLLYPLRSFLSRYIHSSPRKTKNTLSEKCNDAWEKILELGVYTRARRCLLEKAQ